MAGDIHCASNPIQQCDQVPTQYRASYKYQHPLLHNEFLMERLSRGCTWP